MTIISLESKRLKLKDKKPKELMKKDKIKKDISFPWLGNIYLIEKI